MNIFQAPAMPAPSEKSMGNLEMRDYFAAKALPQCLSRAQGMYMRLPFDEMADIVAQDAYELADAMLKARKK